MALAGQVSAGLTPGEGELERARAALTAIGLMVLNASASERAREVLALVERSRVTEHGAGSTRVEYRPPGADDAR